MSLPSILSNYKISRGMAVERDAVVKRIEEWNRKWENAGLHIHEKDVIIDLTNTSDSVIREQLQRLKRV